VNGKGAEDVEKVGGAGAGLAAPADSRADLIER
jgi:hypothetical protein